VDVPIFCVSARWGLESCRTGDRSLWRSSGLESLNRYLMDVLVRDKVSAIREVVERKTADVLGEALLQLRLSICSLRMPIEQLEQCLEMLNAKIAEARSLRMAAADMLTGDRKRLHQELEDHADVLRAQARDYLDSIVRKIVSDTHRIDEQVVQDAMAGAVPGYFEHQLRHTTQMFRNRTTQTLSTHQERANQLIESLRMAASDMFDVPYDAPGSAETLVTAQKPYWVTHTWSNTILPVPVSLIDRLMPAAIRRKRVLERLSAQVSDLVMRNVENLRWATFQSIDETFLRFSQTLDRRLADTIAATHGAVQVAMQKRQNAGQLVKADEEVLAKAVTHLELLNSQLRVTSSDSCDTV